MAQTYSNRPGRTDTVVSATANMPFLRRISWGAVLAGVVVALVFQMMFQALGLAIGAASIDPLMNATPTLPEFGAGVVIWLAAGALLALFAGGIVAGRMAATVSHTEAIMHGITTWAVTMLLSAYIVLSGGSSIIGGVTNALGSVFNAAANGASAAAPAVATALESQNIEVQGITEEIQQLLGGTQQATGAATGGETATEAEATEDINNFLTEGSAAQRRAVFNLTQLFAGGPDAAQAETYRTEVVNALTTQGGLTEQEARDRIADWENRVGTLRTQAEQTIEEASSTFADAVAAAAGVIFAIMIVGAAAAGGGALVGAPKPEYVVNKTQDVAEAAANAEVRR